MGSISLLQWRKAYMLEFMDGNDVKDCFTFSVPPESEEFQFSQRITETKTFGGSVFDDFGNDSYRITISGTTVNEDKKLIYKGNKKAPQYLTGTKEIFELQKIIKNWADNIYAEGFFRKKSGTVGSKKKVYLYDLSKMSVLQIATGTASRNYWRVFIKDFKIKRDKSKPKTYNYNLELIGIDEPRPDKLGFLNSLGDAVDTLQNAMDYVQTVLDLTEGVTAAASQVAAHCNDVKRAYETVKNRDISAGLVAVNVGSAADLVNRILGGDSNTFYNSAKNVLAAVSGFKALSGSNETDAQSGKIQKTDNFTVAFNSNGGSSVKSQSVSYSSKVTEPAPPPTREDFIFAGWFSDAELTAQYDFSQEVTHSFTLYAKWVLATATVTFNSRNGSQVTPQKVAVGSPANVPTPPTRNGYSFDAWYTDYSCTNLYDFATPVTENITLYAGWNKVYSVVFESLGGSAVDTQIVSVGGLAVYPKTPVKENYTFAYWCSDSALQNVYDFSTAVNSDITLYACWVQISNTVTFNSLGGSSVASERVAIGGYATEPEAPVKEGYDFNYWATDQAGTNEFRFATTPVNANITLYAKWTESKCEVTFDSDGGSAVDTQEVNYGSRAIFPAIPTKDGYTFEMWRVSKEVDTGEVDENQNPIMATVYEEYDFSTPVKEDITLYALWFGGSE